MKTRYEEIQAQIDILRAEARVISDRDNDAFIAKQKKYYEDNIAGKIFYGDSSTWGGYYGLLFIYKPISCDDWSAYNSCKVLKFEIQFNKADNSIYQVTNKVDTFRVDSFVTHLTIMTPEIMAKIKNMLDIGFASILNMYTS